MQPTTYNVNVYCAKHIPEHRFIHKSRTLFALFKITFIVLTPTALYEASRTSVRLKQWDEKHRQCAVFRLRESVCVYSVCWAPAVGHWLPPTLGVSYWTRAVSPACWTVGCSKHGGVMALGLNASEFNCRETQTERNAEPISKKQKGKTSNLKLLLSLP